MADTTTTRNDTQTTAERDRTTLRAQRKLTLGEKAAGLSQTKRQILAHLHQAGVGTHFQIAGWVDPIIYAPTILNPQLAPELKVYERVMQTGSLDDPDELGADLAIAQVLPAEDGEAILELHDGRVVALPAHVSVHECEQARLRLKVKPEQLRTYVLTQVADKQVETLARELSLDARQLAGIELVARRWRRVYENRVKNALTQLAAEGFIKRLVLKRERGEARLRALADAEVRGPTDSKGERGRPPTLFQLTPQGVDIVVSMSKISPAERQSIKKHSVGLSRADHSLGASVFYGYANAGSWLGLYDIDRFDREHQWQLDELTGGKKPGKQQLRPVKSALPRSDVLIEVSPVGSRGKQRFELVVEVDMATTRKRRPRPGDDQSLFLYSDWGNYAELAKRRGEQMFLIQMVPAFAYTKPETQALTHAALDEEFRSEVGNVCVHCDERDAKRAKAGRPRKEPRTACECLTFIHLENPVPREVWLRLVRNVLILERRLTSDSKAA
jgi:hypothetical protein